MMIMFMDNEDDLVLYDCLMYGGNGHLIKALYHLLIISSFDNLSVIVIDIQVIKMIIGSCSMTMICIWYHIWYDI